MFKSNFLCVALQGIEPARPDDRSDGDLELRKLLHYPRLASSGRALYYRSNINKGEIVALPGIEPGSGASETLILSIVRQGPFN